MGDDVGGRKHSIHIGLIPDGNRRYAKKRSKPPWYGHLLGAKKMYDFVEWCTEYPEIKRITIYALSIENIEREREEVDKLWEIYKKEFQRLLTDDRVSRNGISVRVLGNDGLWKPGMKEAVKEVVDSTKNYSKYILNIMLAYGSKFEINRAVKEVIKRPVNTIDRFLMVREPLDLVIRTGGQHRLSNFMLYQASYAELAFTKKLWPEFTKRDLKRIMEWYFEQQRRFGK